MKKFRKILISLGLLLAFTIFTVLISVVDVAAIGPNGSSVGFASINGAFHNFTGVHFAVYEITDWGSLATIPIGLVFAIIGLVQLIKRKSIFKVDGNILALGIFYILTFCAYALFEFVVINCRPVLIDGVLETSYPSSTTMLALTICVTAIDQINIYFKNKNIRLSLMVAIVIYCLFLVVGRIISGVHWITDIFAGVLLSSTLIMCYFGLKDLFLNKDILSE